MIELDLTYGERVCGIGYNTKKADYEWSQPDEPEIELDQVTGETIEASNED